MSIYFLRDSREHLSETSCMFYIVGVMFYIVLRYDLNYFLASPLQLLSSQCTSSHNPGTFTLLFALWENLTEWG
jgi:hypothetical protein